MLDSMNSRQLTAAILISIVVAVASGCDEQTAPRARLLPQPQAAIESPPAVNLPPALRQTNWTSAAGEGSCVIASTVSLVRWQRQYQVADFFRRTYSGGQTATSIQQKLTAAGIRFVCTEPENGQPADSAFLQWASDSRRGAIIWFYPSHCVTFCGFGVDDGKSVAYLLDNNRTQRFIKIPRDQFLRAWAGYGGFALTTLGDPIAPLPWPAIEFEE